jgi:hypothetical protein
VKVEDQLWYAAHAKAAERGDVVSEVIRAALERYVTEEDQDNQSRVTQ